MEGRTEAARPFALPLRFYSGAASWWRSVPSVHTRAFRSKPNPSVKIGVRTKGHHCASLCPRGSSSPYSQCSPAAARSPAWLRYRDRRQGLRSIASRLHRDEGIILRPMQRMEYSIPVSGRIEQGAVIFFGLWITASEGLAADATEYLAMHHRTSIARYTLYFHVAK